VSRGGLVCNIDDATGAYGVLIWTPLSALIFRVILIVGRNRGLTEEAARAQGLELKVGHFSYQANGKAIALCDSEGLIKTIFDA
jgi:hypothetical protein